MTTKSKPNFGDILLRDKVISPSRLSQAQRDVAEKGGSLSGALVRYGVSQPEILIALAEAYKLPTINLSGITIPDQVKVKIPRNLIERYQMVPVSVDENAKKITIALFDPSNLDAIMADIKFMCGFQVEAVLTTEDEIQLAIKHFFGEDTVDDLLKLLTDEDVKILRGETAIDAEVLERDAAEPDIIRLVNLVLIDAIRKGASDIHFEGFEKFFQIRYRLDGVMHVALTPAIKFRDAIITRIKVLSELNIAEHRLPQDGRIKLVIGDQKEVDFRVSVLPCLNGENAVLRILEQTSLQLDLAKLGFEPEQLRIFRDAVEAPWGMILLTGPTGSGKSTTLYSALMTINTPTRKILTAEDPVEMNIPGLNQAQMNDAIGYNFAKALRSFLRQDPDVIMVGEIRDFETAEIAVKAALTGHLVLSTLHTNDAPATVTRLLGMGIEPFLVSNAVNLIAAQRLVRKICQNCKEVLDVPREALIDFGLTSEQAETAQIWHGAGCRQCNLTGYKGRIGLYEVLAMGDEIKECVIQGYTASELAKEAQRLGMKTLRESGIAKMLAGITTLEELRRVTRR